MTYNVLGGTLNLAVFIHQCSLQCGLSPSLTHVIHSSTDQSQSTNSCLLITVQSGPEKIAQTLILHQSAIVCSRIKQFLPQICTKYQMPYLLFTLYHLV